MIRLRDVSFSFPGRDGRPVLEGITLRIDDGEWVAVTGGNGSGKSTLCRLIAGLARPSAGSISVDAGDACAASRSGGGPRVGLAFQNPDSQLCTSTVRNEVRFGPENIGLGEDEISKRFERLAGVFGLAGLAGRNPHTLSGGEKQRVILASISAMHPNCLILDEPFSFLDGRSRKSLLESVRSEYVNSGKTVIWTTVDREEVDLADRVLHLEAGRIVYDGRTAGLSVSLHGGVLVDSSGAGAGEEGRNRPHGVSNRAGAAMAVSKHHSVSNTAAEAGIQGSVSIGAEAVRISGAEFGYPDGSFRLHVDDLSISGGESLGLSGASGSGKTTLLLACSGLMPPARGAVSVFGGRITRRKDFPAGKVALLFQTPEEGFFAPTVFDEVVLGYRSYRGRDGEREAVRQALRHVGLDPEGVLDRSPFHLSQGQKRLVSIASMLVIPAGLYCFDEPLLFLDGRARRLVVEAIGRLRDQRASVVIASHDPSLLRNITDRVIRLEDGLVDCDRLGDNGLVQSGR